MKTKYYLNGAEITPEQARHLKPISITEEVVILRDYTEKEKAEEEHKTLKKWFDVEYARLEQKFRRLHTLGKTTDSGKNAYDELVDLYNTAEINRKRIQELEALIDS